MNQIYIVSEGVRIGFFNNIEEAQVAIKLCKSGYIVSQKRWEEQC